MFLLSVVLLRALPHLCKPSGAVVSVVDVQTYCLSTYK